MTSYSAQGTTVDRVLLQIDTFDYRLSSLIDKTLAYVGASRAQYDIRIFTDDATKLERSLARENERAKALSPEQIRAYRSEERSIAYVELILPHLPPKLQQAILSPGYSEVCANEDGRVFVEAAGSNTMVELAGIAPTQAQLRHAVNAIARTLARREVDETNPILNARLPDGSRIARRAAGKHFLSADPQARGRPPSSRLCWT
jgi:hypothetical protein